MVPPILALITLSIFSPLATLARSISLDNRAPAIPAVVLANNGTDQNGEAGTDDELDFGKKLSVGTTQPQCVDAVAHPEWGSQSGGVESSACVAALAAIQQSAGPDVASSHLFYSLRTFPRWPPEPGAIGLPQGQIAPVARGNCVFMLRMKRDFSNEILPLTGGGYLPTEDLPVQTRTWREVFQAATGILNSCVRRRGGGMAGWNTVGFGKSMDHEALVVAFWPRNSVVDLMYGPGVKDLGGNFTVLETSPQQTT